MRLEDGATAGVDTGIAGSDIRVVATGPGGGDPVIQVVFGGLNAERDIALDAISATGASVDAGESLAAGRDIAIASSTGSVTLVNATAGDDIVLRAPGGVVTVSGDLDATGLGSDSPGWGDTLATAFPLTIFGVTEQPLTGGANIDVGGLRAALNAAMFRPAATLRAVATGADSGGAALLIGGTTTACGTRTWRWTPRAPAMLQVTGSLSASRDVAIEASQGGVTITSATAGDDIVLRAPGGLVNVSGTLTTTGQGSDGAGAGDALATAFPLTIFGAAEQPLTGAANIDIGGQRVALSGNVSASGDLRAVATGADSGGAALSITGASVAAGRDLVLDASGAGSLLANGQLSGGRDVAIATNASSVALTALTAGRDVAVSSGQGGVVLASASAGDDIAIRAANGQVSVSGSLTAGGGADGVGAADTLASASPLIIFGAAEGPLSGGASVDIGAQQVLLSGAVTAGADIRVVATGPDDDPALQALGPLNAGRDIVLDASSTGGASIVATGGLTAGRDVAAYAPSGSVTIGTVTAGDDAVFGARTTVALNGPVTTTGSTGDQGAGLVLFDLLATPLDNLFTLNGQSGIFISANSLSNPSGFALAGASQLGIALSDPSGMTLGDTDSPSAGGQIDVSTLQTPNVALFAASQVPSQGGTPTGGVAIGDATLPSGLTTSLKIYTSGPVTVTGAFVPAANNTVKLTIGDGDVAAWTPSLIEVINDSDDGHPGPDHGSLGSGTLTSISAAPSPLLSFNSITLNSTGSIYFGSSDYIAVVSDPSLDLATFSPETPRPALPLNTSRTILFAAGTLNLAASDRILQQDTNGFGSTASLGTGGYVAKSLSLDGYGGVAPSIIDLYLSLGSPRPVFGPAAALASEIDLSTGRNGLYRVNTCVIGELAPACPSRTSCSISVSISTPVSSPSSTWNRPTRKTWKIPPSPALPTRRSGVSRSEPYDPQT